MRVRMFCDWDNDPESLRDRLIEQTDDFHGYDYKNLNFVIDDSYTHAICFNFPTYELVSPAQNNVALILEPPELVKSMFSAQHKAKYTNVRKIYSFAADVYEEAFGIGFATVKDQEYPKLLEKPKKICMITSNKLMTPWHKKRQQVRDALLETDLEIDFYGRGLTGNDPRIKGEIPPMRKHEILSQYQLCIDFENSPHCAVTDKFFDPVLCNTMPVSNAAILHSLVDQDSFFYVNFDYSINDIIDDIADICEFEPGFDNEIALWQARKEIRSGSLSLAEWIYERVKETL